MSDWFTAEEIKSQKIEHVIFCGDWFHHRDSIDVRSLNVANAIINAISKDCHLHLLIGNHDCYYKDTTSINSIQQWSEIDNVSVYNTLNFHFGWSFCNDCNICNLYKHVSKKNITGIEK